MKNVYRLIAECVFVVHVIVCVLGVMMWKWWDVLFPLYTLLLIGSFLSWTINRRCILTDIENFFRIRAGQDIYQVTQTFLGYWGGKVLGKHAPSDYFITVVIVSFLLTITPWWIYLSFLRYIQ